MNNVETISTETWSQAAKEETQYPWQKFKPWKDVTPEEWYDWNWQYHHLVTTPEEYVDLFPDAEDEIAEIRSTLGKYKFASTPYYLSLIDPKNPEDPIKLQAVPSRLEMNIEPHADLRDPLAEDRDMPVPGLVHRYPDRVLFLITEICSLYCRFCILGNLIGVVKMGHKIDRLVFLEHFYELLGDPHGANDRNSGPNSDDNYMGNLP